MMISLEFSQLIIIIETGRLVLGYPVDFLYCT